MLLSEVLELIYVYYWPNSKSRHEVSERLLVWDALVTQLKALYVDCSHQL